MLSFAHNIIDAVSHDDLRVPPFPPVLFRLAGMLSTGNYTVETLTRTIASSSSLTALVLRQASSAALAAAVPARTLELACSRIGAKAIQELVVVVGLGDVACAEGPLAELRAAAWQHSVCAAELCQYIAGLRGLPASEAYLVGLLHDFGEALALGIVERDLALAQHDPPPQRSAEEWMNEIHLYNAELCLAIVAKWQLPEFLVDVIGGYHYGAVSAPRIAALVNVAKLVDTIAVQIEAGPAVNLDQLTGVAHFRDVAEARRVLEFLPRLPALVQPYQRESRPDTPVSSWVRRTPIHLTGIVHDVDFVVKRRRLPGVRTYRATRMSANALAMVGTDPMPTHAVVELELVTDAGPFHVWARAASCEARGDGFDIIVKPMVLNPGSHRLWAALWAISTAPPSAR